MSSFTCFSNDHSLGTGSPSLGLHFSKSATAETPGSAAVSPGSAATSSMSRFGSLVILNLIVDLSSYPLQWLTDLCSLLSRLATRQHPMVLYPRLPKTTHLTTSLAVLTGPLCQVLSHPTYEPIACDDADKYEAWYDAMQDEIQALYSNDT